MADKQEWLKAAGPAFLNRIQAEYPGVRSIHVGITTSSLGGSGADSCSPRAAQFNPSQNDRAHLVDRVDAAGTPATTYENRGYLAWDPDGILEPPGEPNMSLLSSQLQAMILGAGEVGCGFEAPLEAWRRFLFDPDPYERVDRIPCYDGDRSDGCSVPVGIDDELLRQREGFLRPDSALAIVMLTDENDCSMNFETIEPNTRSQAFIFLQQQQESTGELFHMPRATDPCLDDPTDPCCFSCGQKEPEGCPATNSYPSCNVNSGWHDDASKEDPINLRCYDQKRRFGIDALQPIERYVNALNHRRIENRDGELVPNPVYADLEAGMENARGRELVFLVGLVGVPWQNLARPGSMDESDLEYMSAKELRETGRWDVLVGDPENRVPPSDPLMRESIAPRSGMSFAGVPMAPPTAGPLANPINGHEWHIDDSDDLQYACIFPLQTPRPLGNDCVSTPQIELKPLCQNPQTGAYSETQHFAKAFPGTRQLQVLEGFGDNSVVASLCAASARPNFPDLGYHAAFDALVEQLGKRLAR